MKRRDQADAGVDELETFVTTEGQIIRPEFPLDAADDRADDLEDQDAPETEDDREGVL